MSNVLASDTTDLITAWGSAIGAGATAVAAIAAVAAAVVAIRTLRASKRDSRDRSRPMVGALLERDPHPTSRCADLVVRNYGGSVAYDVQVTFDPPLMDAGTDSGQDSFVPLLLSRYESPISNLMPGVELRNLWFAPGKIENEVRQNDEPIPDVVTATIRYSDRPDFWSKDVNRYVETFKLDISLIRGDVITTHTDDHLGLHKRSTNAAESIAPAMESLARNVSRIESYLKPDAVLARERAEAEESRRVHDELVRQLLPNRTDTSTETEAG